jgi:hypothetical protein
LARCTSTVTLAASSPSRARLCTKDKLIHNSPKNGAQYCGAQDSKAPARCMLYFYTVILTQAAVCWCTEIGEAGKL